MKGLIRWLALIVVLTNTNSFVFGQSRDDLENERNKIIRQIELTSNHLQKTQINKKAAIDDLKIIESQIESRNQLIANIDNQLNQANASLNQNATILDSLNTNLNEITNDYNELSRVNYIHKLSTNKWLYILSSKN